MASKSARMRGSAHLKAVTVAHQKSYVISSVFCENSAAHDETATRLYLPIRAGRLHEWFLLLYVRSEKDRLCFALRALGAIVKLLKIRSRLGQPGPGLSSAGYLPRSPDFPCYGFLRRPGQLDSRTSYLHLYPARMSG